MQQYGIVWCGNIYHIPLYHHKSLHIQLSHLFYGCHRHQRFMSSISVFVFILLLVYVQTAAVAANNNEVRIWFMDMWDDFNPQYNFFVLLLEHAAQRAHPSYQVLVTETNPSLILFGPFGNEHESPRWTGLPKVFFTGENLPSSMHADVFLNLGFRYHVVEPKAYMRFPLWLLAIDWFNADADKIANPKPIPLAKYTSVDPTLVEAKSKFCAFVVSNAHNAIRNGAFQDLSTYKRVDSAGRLFNNMGGNLPSGRGGGGGEIIKVDFYRDYKFVLTYENSFGEGYCTEKLLHAKAAGAVPIYWGDPFVSRDFNPVGFIDATNLSREELLARVKQLDEDPVAFRAMASEPALSASTVRFYQRTMDMVVSAMVSQVLGQPVVIDTDAWRIDAWQTPKPILVTKTAIEAATDAAADAATESAPSRIYVTACSPEFVDSAILMLKSRMPSSQPVEYVVYVWPSVSEAQQEALRLLGATVSILPTEDFVPWPEFWEPKYFAWKTWILHTLAVTRPAGTKILYVDAGVLPVRPLEAVWQVIEAEGVFLVDDPEQPNERWCHPVFCEIMRTTTEELKATQIIAGIQGFTVGGKFDVPYIRAAYDVAVTHRDVIVGEKWQAYSDVCQGHRHEQSVYSILSLRNAAPRQVIYDWYSHESLEGAISGGATFYVHRSYFVERRAFAPSIDTAWVVNLDRRVDRLQRFRSTHMNVAHSVRRWKAVDGRNLTMTSNLAKLFVANNFLWKKAVMGCVLSHLGLWWRLAQDSRPDVNYLVLEDDVHLLPGWREHWWQIAPFLPADADVVFLGGVLPMNRGVFMTLVEPVNDHFGKIAMNTAYGVPPSRYFHFCTYSYLLTKKGAQKLMASVGKHGIFASADHMIVNQAITDMLNIYFTTPMVAISTQEDDPNYLVSNHNDLSRVDSFDSDLWNNNDHFTLEEVEEAKGVQHSTETNEKVDFVMATWNTLEELQFRDMEKRNVDIMHSILAHVYGL